LCALEFCSIATAQYNAFPSGYMPFTSIYRISSPDANGNRLVEGLTTEPLFYYIYTHLTPPSTRQQFSNNSIELAPGQYFSNVYIPTAQELVGNFDDVAFPVYNTLDGIPYPGNIIPPSLLGDEYAFLVGPDTTPTASTFLPITPCRIADTRNPTAPLGGPFLSAGTTRSFDILSSTCGIATNATAFTLHVAVVPHGPLGYLTVWPAGQDQPLVSTLNSADGRVKGNEIIVQSGTSGQVSFYATNDTDVVVDVSGYFVPASSGTGLAFYPLTPCRVADTRNDTAPLGGPYLSGGQSRDFPILSSNCGLPSTAQAYSFNFAAIPKNGNPLGYLTAWPASQTQPVVSSLNAPTGTVTANAALVAAGAAGDVSLSASNDTDLVIDTNGYFAPAGVGGLNLYSVPPCRVLDTRAATQAFTGNLVVTIGGYCGVPSTASAVIVNASVVPAGPLGYLTLWGSGNTAPEAASLNASDGTITSNMAIVPLASGSISAFASNSTQLILDVTGYFAP